MNGDDYVEETCAKYYPLVQGAAVHTTNGVDVTLLKLVTSDHVTTRVLRLSSEALDQPRDVTQYQLQSWKMYDQVRTLSRVHTGDKMSSGRQFVVGIDTATIYA